MKFLNKIKDERSGQSLIEILIALTIGAILIGAASIAVVTVLQSGESSQRSQSASVLVQDYAEKIRNFASSEWHTLYNLNKTSSTLYHFEASSTQIIVVEGKEGVVDNDIRGNIQGYWRLDEASSTEAFDSSDNDNNGTITGATATSSCKVGRCYNFDGSSDFINAGSSSTLQISDAITLSSWVYPDSVPAVSDTGIAGTDMSAYQLTYDSDGEAKFYINSTGNSIGSSLSAGEWHHVVGVWDGTTDSGGLRLYIDGDLSASSTSGQASIGGWSDFLIGREPSGNYFDGKIDDIRVYNRALSSDDIEHLNNSIILTRYFYVENVCRTNDSNYDLAGVMPCGAGEIEDPSTQKITVVVEWDEGQFSVDNYVTRWRNKTFSQSDWSGGSGFDGPVTKPTNKYSTSTNISTSTGSIKVEGI